MFCTAKDRLLQRKTWHIAAPFAVLSVYGLFCVSAVSVFRLFLCFVCFRVLFVSAFRRFLCFGVICNPPKYAIRICNPLKPLRLAVSKQGLFNRIANPYNKNRRIANPPEQILCFGVICNPPNYTIRICNPLKPLCLAVSKQ